MPLKKPSNRQQRQHSYSVYGHARPFLTVAVLVSPILFNFFFSKALHAEKPLDIQDMGKGISLYTASPADDNELSKAWPKVIFRKLDERSSDKRLLFAAFSQDNYTDKFKPLSIRRWAELLAEESDASSRIATDMARIMRESRLSAFRFETKGCNQSNMGEKQFEFVLLSDSHLASFGATADPTFFEEHFHAYDKLVPAITFPNIGGNAILVAPQPQPSPGTLMQDTYGHCANFMRKAPTSQILKTWQLVAKSFLQRVEERGEKSVWLSTAGNGVPWLHFRLDDRPKYYRYQLFAAET